MADSFRIMDNKKFIESLSERLDVSVATVSQLIETMSKELAVIGSDMDALVVPGFGTFEPKIREERVSVHPATGKRLLVPPRIFMTFKQSPVLKQRINHGK